MPQLHSETKTGKGRLARRARLRQLAASRDGAAAIEFAILAIPYFVIIFAILETFIAYTGEQLVSNAVDNMSRKIRTGTITAANTDRAAFRTAFCEEISIIIKCGDSEVQTPNKLHLDVRSFATFAQIPVTIPLSGNGDLDTGSFGYAPGAQKSINMLRAYYQWEVVTDLVRPYITNVRPSGGRPNYFLIVETATFRNEDYP